MTFRRQSNNEPSSAGHWVRPSIFSPPAAAAAPPGSETDRPPPAFQSSVALPLRGDRRSGAGGRTCGPLALPCQLCERRLPFRKAGRDVAEPGDDAADPAWPLLPGEPRKNQQPGLADHPVIALRADREQRCHSGAVLPGGKGSGNAGDFSVSPVVSDNLALPVLEFDGIASSRIVR